MNLKNALLLIVLAALWGASFLFIRVGVAEFGVAPLMALRVGIGALFLVALMLTRYAPRELIALLRQHAWPLFVVGLLNSAAPFCLFAFAELTLSAGVTSVINATTPLWGALVAYLWLKDSLSLPRALGLVIGFAGVLTLVWDQVFSPHGANPASPATAALAAAAALGATLLYGIAANFTKRKLTGVDPLVSATGSMVGATILLLPFALATWPAAPVSAHAWGSVLALGIACTGVAYFIFFHLIAHIGPARAITVTFVIPVFGILWGALFLGERVSFAMLEGCVIVLLGTALATGAIRRIPGVRPQRNETA
ncbi:DMT family permease [Burkholderia pseudomallei]|uniref:Membrane protein n=2 Tax=Burkholderia pseudomallei TaxID=28450 RepID=Q63VF8_BURPS|nr:DMT family transporter [Burkholderia pseudomallei]ABN84758.1 putative membrane protein [Burkholderia pseudomallei 668]AIP13614.1 eamA-like transporter family protein [Burkholderia pseudomallei]AIV46902.1 eamA-like transporter family protein [Burkholderia pseudomallei TSV 48]AIV66738.1 eamA-like transporter family protein [Burkholderia pseudomallei K42]AIV89038.1 eamA-like transporter family protein [Burkholderia pseudomallei B03]